MHTALSIVAGGFADGDGAYRGPKIWALLYTEY